MRLIVLILVVAQPLQAQIFGAEPACAIPCLTSAFSIAGCAVNDQACQCGTGQLAIASAVAPCLFSACTNNNDLNSAISVGQSLCSAFSATLTEIGAATTSTALPIAKTTSTTSIARTTQLESSTTVSTETINSATKSSTTDLPGSSPSSTSSIISSAIPSTSTSSQQSSTSTSHSSASSTAASEPHGLSTGTKAAIGVGAVLGICLLGGAILFGFWYGRRSARKTSARPAEVDHETRAGELSLEGRTETIKQPLPELGHGEAMRAELEAKG